MYKRYFNALFPKIDTMSYKFDYAKKYKILAPDKSHQTNPAQYPCPGEPPEHSNVPNKPHVFSGNECPTHTEGGESACCCYVAPTQYL